MKSRFAAAKWHFPTHPADRFLVATALVFDLTLVTADDTLIGAKACPILANRRGR